MINNSIKLDWLNACGYALFVYDFPHFLRNDRDSKDFFIKHFQDFILPFWEDEVTRVLVDGKAKSFNVYSKRDYCLPNKWQRHIAFSSGYKKSLQKNCDA
jgi:isocitrate dehydrogenase kinase/phosphatase